MNSRSLLKSTIPNGTVRILRKRGNPAKTVNCRKADELCRTNVPKPKIVQKVPNTRGGWKLPHNPIAGALKKRGG